MSRKQQLMTKLPRLPPKVDRRIRSFTLEGLSSQISDRSQLTDPKRRYRLFRNPDFVQVPDPDVDLMKTNSVRRRIMVFDGSHEGFRQSLNVALSGGEGNTLVTTSLGLGLAVVSGGASLIWTGLVTYIELSRDNQPVRVRKGDEVHQVEIVGVSGGKIFHLEWFILVDPFRARANREISKWIIHDERHELHFD